MALCLRLTVNLNDKVGLPIWGLVHEFIRNYFLCLLSLPLKQEI